MNNENQGSVPEYKAIILPLKMHWEPKEDITTFELAQCLPYLMRTHGAMPWEVDLNEPHFRHFRVIDHNKKDSGSRQPAQNKR